MLINDPLFNMFLDKTGLNLEAISELWTFFPAAVKKTSALSQ